jgi:hypothetical protein
LASKFHKVGGLHAISQGLCKSLLSKLTFQICCFPGEGDATFAASLGTLSTLNHLHFLESSTPDSNFFCGLKHGLAVNNSLIELEIISLNSYAKIPDAYLMEWFGGLQTNETLRSLTLPYLSWSVPICDTLRECLEKNSGLRTLVILASALLSNNNWQRILPYSFMSI